MTRLTKIIFVVVILGFAAGLVYRQWSLAPSDIPDPVGDDWPPLAYLEQTGDVAVITGEFGGMADDDHFRINTTRHVITNEGTYAETDTRVAVIGIHTVIQSAATGEQVNYSALVRLAPASPIFVMVQRAMEAEPVVNAYLIIIP